MWVVELKWGDMFLGCGMQDETYSVICDLLENTVK
jgi:hypothetical protein